MVSYDILLYIIFYQFVDYIRSWMVDISNKFMAHTVGILLDLEILILLVVTNTCSYHIHSSNIGTTVDILPFLIENMTSLKTICRCMYQRGVMDTGLVLDWIVYRLMNPRRIVPQEKNSVGVHRGHLTSSWIIPI